MEQLTSESARLLETLISITREYQGDNRESIVVCTEEVNVRMGGQLRVGYRNEKALREAADWCREVDIPVLTMMMSADAGGILYDEPACKAAFKGNPPKRSEMKAIWRAEQGRIAAMDAEDLDAASDLLREAIDGMNAAAGKRGPSRRELVNSTKQEIEPESFAACLSRYRKRVEAEAPGEPLMHNAWIADMEGYKEQAWRRWRDMLAFGGWDAADIGSGKFARLLQETLGDDGANWITKRYGVFDIAEKASSTAHGLEDFERAAYGFYAEDLAAKDFFEECIRLLGRQYSVVSHLMFLKDMGLYVPVKPDAFHAGLRRMGIEFYLSGCCSWDNYSRFLGYLRAVQERLQEEDPETTLLDAHSFVWVVSWLGEEADGSGDAR